MGQWLRAQGLGFRAKGRRRWMLGVAQARSASVPLGYGATVPAPLTGSVALGRCAGTAYEEEIFTANSLAVIQQAVLSAAEVLFSVLTILISVPEVLFSVLIILLA